MERATQNCLLCGLPLEYLTASHEMTCSLCGGAGRGYMKCSASHYVCDACHNLDAMGFIREASMKAASADPFATAELMMGHPSVPMLGCQHAFIAAGALLSALRNAGVSIEDGDIDEAFARLGRQAAGGYCGLTGVCGIVPAMGACFSILTGARCGTDSEQRMVMEAVVKTASAIGALTGPSCCKAYVRASLEVAADMLCDRAGIPLAGRGRKTACSHASSHPHGCRLERCPYYDRSAGISAAFAIFDKLAGNEKKNPT
jgi:hypothetical protein